MTPEQLKKGEDLQYKINQLSSKIDTLHHEEKRPYRISIAAGRDNYAVQLDKADDETTFNTIITLLDSSFQSRCRELEKEFSEL